MTVSFTAGVAVFSCVLGGVGRHVVLRVRAGIVSVDVVLLLKELFDFLCHRGELSDVHLPTLIVVCLPMVHASSSSCCCLCPSEVGRVSV